MGFDVSRYVADKFMPIADADRLATSDMTAAQFWLSQVGTQVPSQKAEAGKAKAGKYAQGQAKSAAKKRTVEEETAKKKLEGLENAITR